MILKLKFNNKLHLQCYFDHKNFPFFSLNRQISVQSTQLSERSLLFFCIYVYLYTELSIAYAVYYTHPHAHSTHTFHTKTSLFAYNWHHLLLLQIHCHPLHFVFCTPFMLSNSQNRMYYILYPFGYLWIEYNQIWRQEGREIWIILAVRCGRLGQAKWASWWDWMAVKLIGGRWCFVKLIKVGMSIFEAILRIILKLSKLTGLILRTSRGTVTM